MIPGELLLNRPFAQSTLGAQVIKTARNRPRVLPKLARLALEAIDFLDHFDRNQDAVVSKGKEGVGVVEENIGIKYVVFHAARLRI